MRELAEKTYLFRVPYYGFCIWFLKKVGLSGHRSGFDIWLVTCSGLMLGLGVQSGGNLELPSYWIEFHHIFVVEE